MVLKMMVRNGNRSKSRVKVKHWDEAEAGDVKLQLQMMKIRRVRTAGERNAAPAMRGEGGLTVLK